MVFLLKSWCLHNIVYHREIRPKSAGLQQKEILTGKPWAMFFLVLPFTYNLELLVVFFLNFLQDIIKFEFRFCLLQTDNKVL